MKPLAHLSAVLALAALLSACQEELTTPVDCPELCPGTSLTVRDTVLTANLDGDSTYTGYVGGNEIVALLVSSGIDAGESRAFMTFPRRSDSVLVDGQQLFLTVDSIAVSVQLLSRDTLIPGVKLYIHRITPDLDTTATLADLDAQMTTGTLVDSATVLDTLKRGAVRMVLKGSDITKLTAAEADSGRIGIGIRIGAGLSTGVRLGSINSSLGGPTIITWGTVAIADTSKVRQSATALAEKTNYVIETPPVPADRIWLGGKSGARSILRFTLPAYLRDSTTVLRATLELTPGIALRGLRNDSPTLEIRGLLADLGAKSPALVNVAGSVLIPTGQTEVLPADVRDIVVTWFTANAPPPTSLILAILPEGASFSRPEFLSSRAGSGSPRLRITYAIPSRPGHP